MTPPGPPTAKDASSMSSGSEAKSEVMGCGRGQGGLGSSFTWVDSVNSTMDEVKALIISQKKVRQVVSCGSGYRG